MQPYRTKRRPAVERACETCGTLFMVKASKVAIGAGRFCSRPCCPPPITPTPLADRFWPKVNKDGPIPAHCPELGPCWFWTGACFSQGYGVLSLGGRKGGDRSAHRIAYELHYGPLPADVWVLHHCDNPPCVRWEHLFPGTQADNMQDMMAKGRAVRYDRRGDNNPTRKRPETVRRGEAHPMNKVSDAQAAEIRLRYEDGGITMRALGAKYGISQAQVSRFCRGKRRG